MKTWPAFFRDLELNLGLRTFYFNRENGGGSFSEAWALGGSLEFKSGWLLDVFRIGAAGYFSEPAYAPSDRDGTGLLGPGQTGIEVLGEAYAQLRYETYALLTGYRQRVDQGFVNPQDNRMIPNTFEGATVTGTLGPVEYDVGYLTAMKTRSSDTFVNMARAAGVTTGENRGLLLTSVAFAPARLPGIRPPLEGLNVYLGNYYVPDVFNTVYFNPDFKVPLNDDWRLHVGLQFTDQRSTGRGLLGSFSTWNVGALAEVGWRGFSVLAAMSATGPDAGLRVPYGAWPGYLALIVTDFDRANEKAWEVGVSYDWGKSTIDALRIPGLTTAILYAEGTDARDVVNNVALPKRREGDLSISWQPPSVPGLRVRFLNAYVAERGGRVLPEFRIIVDMELPLF
jgi:hypothetical protein